MRNQPETCAVITSIAIRVRQSICGNSQSQIVGALWKAGIAWNFHYIPVYRQPYFEAMGFKAGYCPQAEQYHKEEIGLPMFPALTEADQKWVIASLGKALR